MEAATAPVVQSPRRQPMAEPVAGVAAAPVSSQAAATLPERKKKRPKIGQIDLKALWGKRKQLLF
jgi:hypothetical protein